ncbi:MAG: YhdP family phospholipid transporter, partial [bacterium]
MKRASTVLKHFAFYVLLAAGLIKILAVATAHIALQHRTEIQYWLSQQFGVPVSIAGVNVHWNSYIPRLTLQQLTLGENADLDLGNAQIGLHLPALIARRNVAPINLSLRGTQIHLLRDQSGATRIHGLSQPQSSDDPVDQLVLPAFIRIRDASVTWEDQKRGAIILLDDLDLQLINLGDEYLLDGTLQSSAGSVDIRANVTGNLLTSDWNAAGYARSSSFNTTDMFEEYLPRHYDFDNLLADVEIWTNWKDGQHQGSQGHFEVKPFSVSSKGKSVSIDALSGSLNYMITPIGWQLELVDLQYSTWQQDWWSDTVIISRRQENNVHETHIKADFLRVHDLIELAELEPALQEYLQPLLPLQVFADLENLQLSTLQKDQSTDWQLSTDLTALHTTAHDKLPGITNLDASIQANANHAQMHINTSDAAINLPKLFRTPIELQTLSGQLDWIKQDDDWTLFSQEIIAANQDIQTRTRLSLSSNPLFLDLQTDFQDGDARNAGTYYPTGIMNPNLVQWLDTSIRSGRVTGGSALVYGPLPHFPFHKHHDGHFEVLFDTEEVVLQYQPGWPVARNVKATTRFYNNQLDIAGHQGTILDSRASEIQVSIPRLHPPSQINIEAGVDGDFNDVFRILTETPLNDVFGERVAALSGNGPVNSQFELQIPLDGTLHYPFSGELTLEDATLVLQDWGIELSEANGSLLIDTEQPTASEIQAIALDTPILVDVDTTETAEIRIQASGDFPADNILALAPELPPMDISGSAPFTIDVTLPPNDETEKHASLAINSDLSGIAINAPAPLGKPSDTPRALHVLMPIEDVRKQIHVNYENGFELQLNADDGVNFNLNGTMFELPISEWGEYFSNLDLTGVNGSAIGVRNADVFIDQASFGPVETTNLGVVINHNDNGWFGYLSSELVKGNFTVPDLSNPGPVLVNLSELRIPYEPADDITVRVEAQPKTHPSYLDPRQMPGLRLKINSMYVNEALLGNVDVSAYPIDDGLIFDRLSISDGLVSLTSEGRWTMEQGSPESYLSATLAADDIGTLLSQMRLTENVEDIDGEVTLTA